MLQQPVSHIIGKSRTVLLVGCGDSYDVFGAVPLVVELVLAGRHVHLASLSQTYLAGLSGAAAVSSHPSLYKVGAAAAVNSAYCPEAWLARWLEEQLGRRQPVWCLDRTGVKSMRAALSHLQEQLSVDCVVLIGGGVDALLRGDEHSLGTPAEDFLSLSAVAGLEGVRKVLACIGLGSGARDGIRHVEVFERIAELTRAGAFLGTAALVGKSTSGKVYQDALRYAFENQSNQKRSHVHDLISRAVRGEFGAVDPYSWLSPLLNLFWFFDLNAVARTNLIAAQLETAESFQEIGAIIEAVRRDLPVKSGGAIPI
jgi:hypothetical protein